MLDAPIRSVRLFTKGWPHVLQILAVGIIGMFPIHIGLIFSSVFPGVRTLAPVATALAQGSLMPFGLLFT